MLIYLLLNILYVEYSCHKLVKNGVYTIFTNHHYLYGHDRNLIISENFKYSNTFFRIRMIYKILNNSFYTIERLSNKFKLTIIDNNKLYFNKTKDYLGLWSFIKTGDDEYAIKNENQCYIHIVKYSVLCDSISIDQATKFSLFKIFSEVRQKISKIDSKLLAEEPIDLLIKYIDLRDPNLNRSGIHQIEKDYDNEELRYSIRSILMNIPWIRKIFILMPNEKVRFFKEYKFINNKIIYVKDKELLRYESSNSNSFQFIIWKMKQFGISDNIIIMDDDYFIGKKLKKSDFFYVQNRKIFPFIITSSFLNLDINRVKKNLEYYKIKSKKNIEEQNKDIFFYSKYATILFILNLFNFTSNQKVFIPKFTHNAIPINLNDIKEIYNLVYNSNYKYSTLDCNYRIPGFFQFQIFVLVYTFIKYYRKVKIIPTKYITIDDPNFSYYKYHLFCINKGSGNYSYLNYIKSKIALEYKFHIPSPYEIVDSSLINDSFNFIFDFKQQFKQTENICEQKEKNDFFNYFELFLIVTFFSLIYKKIQ